MRYIKSINESVELMDSVRTFSRNYLANLVDNFFSIKVLPIFNDVYNCVIEITKIDTENKYRNDEFEFNDINNDLIPFLIMLNNEYYLSNDVKLQYKFYDSYGEVKLNIYDIIKSGIPKRYDKHQIYKITIMVR